jgi:hypothetical protein
MNPKNDPHHEKQGLADQATRKARISESIVKQSGLDSRIRGHVSARGRRDQAARSARKGT